MIKKDKNNQEVCPYYKKYDYLKRNNIDDIITKNFRLYFCNKNFNGCSEYEKLENIVGEVSDELQ